MQQQKIASLQESIDKVAKHTEQMLSMPKENLDQEVLEMQEKMAESVRAAQQAQLGPINQKIEKCKLEH